MMTIEKNINMTEETFNVLKKYIKDVNEKEICNLRIPGHSVLVKNTPYVIVTSILDSNTPLEYVAAVQNEIAKIVNEWKQNLDDIPMRYPTYYSVSEQREVGLAGIGIGRLKLNPEKSFGSSNGRFCFTMGKSIQYEFDTKLLGERLREFEEFLRSEGYTKDLSPLTDCDWTYISVNDMGRGDCVFKGIKRR